MIFIWFGIRNVLFDVLMKCWGLFEDDLIGGCSCDYNGGWIKLIK